MRRGLALLLWVLSQGGLAQSTMQVMISFSMPPHLLEETLKDAATHHVTAILNGFYHDSMHETAMKLFDLAKKIPNASVQIDPTAFERYQIHQVPAWVLEGKTTFDVVYGNITFEKAKEEMMRFGDVEKESS